MQVLMKAGRERRQGENSLDFTNFLSEKAN